MNRVFIVGVGRSGTSLLQSVIASHPDVGALPETSFLRRFCFTLSSKKETIFLDRHIKRFPQLELLLKDYYPKHEANLLDVYKEATLSPNVTTILDKDPRLIEFIPDLLNSFPNCKILHIYRDPRDVLVSKKKAGWSAGRSLISYLVASKVQLKDGIDAEKQGQVLSIKYESLITNPKESIENICSYLSLPYDELMLDHSAAAKRLVQAEEFEWKKETLKPINKNNSFKWLNELTAVEALASTYCNIKFIREFGYSLVVPNISFSDRLLAFMYASIACKISAAYRIKRYFITLIRSKKLK